MIPYMGIGFIIPDGGLVVDTIRAANLFRLGGIGQLGLLHAPIIGSGITSSISMLYRHDRYVHSLCVGFICNMIAENVGLSQNLINHAVVAGLTHDTLTPAGGDTVKRIDPEAFDEDQNYNDLFSGIDFQNLLARYG
jgi:hypothetical protein